MMRRWSGGGSWLKYIYWKGDKMLIIYYEGVCPKCGCVDVRNKGWYFECFKCGYIESLSKPTSIKYNAIKEAK